MTCARHPPSNSRKDLTSGNASTSFTGRFGSMVGQRCPRPNVCPKHDPVRRPVTRSPMPRRIHERLQKIHRMPVDPLPVQRQQAHHSPQHVRGQMRHLDPRRDEETAVVRQEMPVPPFRLHRPADELVPASQAVGRRRPCQRRHHAIAGIDQVLQLLSHRLNVAQLVVPEPAGR